MCSARARAAITLLGALLLAGGTRAQPPPNAAVAAGGDAILPLDQVAAGATGFGITSVAGSALERFEVEVLGVWRDLQPGQSFILAKLRGLDLERSGVFGGMSGSPVYLDGKLAGAVSFSWIFASEAIAGITPIEAMRALSALPAGQAPSWSGWRGASAPAPAAAAGLAPRFALERLLRPTALTLDVLAEELQSLRVQRMLPAAAPPGTRSGLQWQAAGLAAPVLDLLARELGGVVQAGRSIAAAPQLVAGSSVAAVLIDGDLQLAVSGTVTERQGERLLAMGHPFLGVGPLALPLAPAEVIAVVPNLRSSFKITNVGPIVGTFDQDRSVGMRGVLGQLPAMVPLSVRVRGEVARDFEVRLANLPALAPSLVGMSVIEAIGATAGAQGVESAQLEAELRLGAHGTLRVAQRLEGQAAGVQGGIYLLLVVGFLVNNPWSAVEVEEISVQVDRAPGVRSRTLLSAFAERSEVAPGERVRVFLELQGHRAERVRREVEVDVPRDAAPGPFFLFVGDGPSVDAARLEIEPREPRSLAEALALLSGLRRRDQIGIIGAAPARGLVQDGRALPDLPGTIRGIHQSTPVVGSKPLGLVVRWERTLPIDLPFDGITRIDLRVARRVS